MNNVAKNRLKKVGSQLASLLRLYMRPQTSKKLVHQFVELLIPHNLGHDLVRIGGSADGGYLLPNDFEGIDCCFSPGVGKKATFEKQLEKMGIRSFLADYSVQGPPDSLADCDFEKKYVGAVNDEHVISLDRWVHEKCPSSQSSDMILQMDIEGAEYETLLATSPETLSRFRMIVLEIHRLNHLSNKLYFSFVHATMKKLLEQFEVAHFHANNLAGLTTMAGIEIPRVAEITLLRKDRVRKKAPVQQLPNPLDQPNVPDQAELLLPEYWWKSGLLSKAA